MSITVSPPLHAAASSPVTSNDTLLPVLRVIPQQCYERSNRKAAALVARAVSLWTVAIAALAFTNSWYLVVPLWIFASLAVSGLFVLGHDCAHGALFESKALNRSVGRALMAPSLHIFEAWVVGHNRIHHGHTLRQGMDFVWHPNTVEEFGAMGRGQQLRHRFEWSAIGSGAYYLRSIWWQKMIRFSAPQRYRAAVRKDRQFLAVVVSLGITTVVAFTIGFDGSIGGAAWNVVKLLVVPFVGFCYSIGSIVYVHHIAPDIKWWPRRSWNSFHGQVEGTTVLNVPKFLNALFFYNIMVHVPHHVDVRIPCYELPRAAAAIIKAFPDVDHRPMRLAEFAKTTRICKLYDFDRQIWLSYRGDAAKGI